MNKRKADRLIVLGLLLLAAALALTVYNMQTELSAGRSAAQVTGALSGLRGAGQTGGAAPGGVALSPGDNAPGKPGNTPVQPAPGGNDAPGMPGNPPAQPAPGGSDAPGMPGNAPAQPAPGEGNAPEGTGMPDVSDLPLGQLWFGSIGSDVLFVPDYIRFPDMEMPVVEVDRHDYIGTLLIPDLGLDLPVMSEWSYPKLKLAPCRYTGSAYGQQLIIVAHNYVTHLGNIQKLPMGTPITFTDMTGNVFRYELAEIEILRPKQVPELLGTDYPLTLVTCTLGGAARVTARCIKVQEIPMVPEGKILSVMPTP